MGRRRGAEAAGFVAQVPYCDNAYCKFEVVAGEDWQVLDGVETGITQVSRQGQGARRLWPALELPAPPRWPCGTSKPGSVGPIASG